MSEDIFINKKEVAKYFDDYLEVYRLWSEEEAGAIHFGVVKKSKDVFSNKQMLRNVSEEAIDLLGIDYEKKGSRFLDAGCGTGQVSRCLAMRFSHNEYKIYGVNLSREQLRVGRKANEKLGLGKRIVLTENDFEKLPFEDSFFEAAFFIESICHGRGKDKKRALEEAARTLKPRGKLLIQDGFVNKKIQRAGGVTLSNLLAKEWRVNNWIQEDLFLAKLDKLGLEVVLTETIFWRMSISVLHVFFLKFPLTLWNYFFGRVKLKEVKGILKSGLLAPLVGLHPGFNYKRIVVVKR